MAEFLTCPISCHSTLMVSYFVGKDASAEFDLIHPLGVIVNFAPEAIIGSLGTVVNQVVLTRPMSRWSHKLLRLVLREEGRRIALKPTRNVGTEWMDRKVSTPVIGPLIHMVLAFMKGGQEPRTKTAVSTKCSGRGGVLTWHLCFQPV